MSNAENPFLMTILEIYSQKREKRGTWIGGRVLRGELKIGQEVEIVGFRTQPILSKVLKVGAFGEKLTHIYADMAIGVLLEGVESNSLGTGSVLAKPKSISAHNQCQAKIKVLSPEEGGRTKPFYSGYRPQFFIYETNFACELTLPEEIPSAPPGWIGLVDIRIEHKIALEIGSRFELREGPKVVVRGEVQNISVY